MALEMYQDDVLDRHTASGRPWTWFEMLDLQLLSRSIIYLFISFFMCSLFHLQSTQVKLNDSHSAQGYTVSGAALTILD